MNTLGADSVRDRAIFPLLCLGECVVQYNVHERFSCVEIGHCVFMLRIGVTCFIKSHDVPFRRSSLASDVDLEIACVRVSVTFFKIFVKVEAMSLSSSDG